MAAVVAAARSRHGRAAPARPPSQRRARPAAWPRRRTPGRGEGTGDGRSGSAAGAGRRWKTRWRWRWRWWWRCRGCGCGTSESQPSNQVLRASTSDASASHESAVACANATPALNTKASARLMSDTRSRRGCTPPTFTNGGRSHRRFTSRRSLVDIRRASWADRQIHLRSTKLAIACLCEWSESRFLQLDHLMFRTRLFW